MKSEPPTPTRAPDNQFRQMQHQLNLYHDQQFTQLLGLGSGGSDSIGDFSPAQRSKPAAGGLREVGGIRLETNNDNGNDNDDNTDNTYTTTTTTTTIEHNTNHNNNTTHHDNKDLIEMSWLKDNNRQDRFTGVCAKTRGVRFHRIRDLKQY